MIVSSRFAIKGDRDIEILWEDGERIFCRERRLNADGKLSRVLVVRLAAEHPIPASLDQLAHEYALRHELEEAWAVRPLELVHERGRTILTLEDPGAEPLDRLFGVPIELDRFLRLAIAIAAALTQLHRRGLIHKDLKPAHILVNAAGEIKFTGFGIASRLSRERQAIDPPETIAGTLAYMAPEQTGRMNRSIDSRSDLYALGVTFYQMLTGALPFTAADPMEWLHCHIARQPIAPAERTQGVPGAVSAIIMKLLAKTAEERYQTAAGLKHDLQRCLATWEARGRIEDFVLGQADTPDRLLIPEKLYGREREIGNLLASFGRVAREGTPELVLVSGHSGIGKSALVHEVHKALVPGLFASGKFDQHKRDVPYATLAQAFQGLIRGLLAKSDADLAPWREALNEALGPLGQLMIDLVPELHLIIGEQPPVPDASPQDAHRRIQLVVRRFIGVFATASHPLALFLDDLQWLDVATLDLIESLLAPSDLPYLFLIGAYRHNEVDAKHPLSRKLVAVRECGARVLEISLAPLTRGSVEQYTIDALRCEPARAAPLAQLMHEKSGGNPFFLIQFLSALAEEGLLAFDHEKALWCWDLEHIHAKGYTENVADLMVEKLSGLRRETRQALLELACLGDGAEVTTLFVVHGTSEQEVHADLRDAARLGLVRLLNSSYAFVHDRVREAAYALEPDEVKRAALHLRIGRLLAADQGQQETSERLYAVANQLNRGITALSSESEREQIIAVNLAAGRRARNAAAYHAAIVYLEIARKLLGEEAHPRCSRTAFAVALLHAECEFLVGHLDVAEAELIVLSQSCSDLQASANVTRLRAQLYTVEGGLQHAVDVCLAFLRQVGIDWSRHPSRSQVDDERQHLRNLAGELSDDQLRALPSMTDAGHHATMGVLADLVTPAFLTDRNLSDMMLLAATRLTLEHGICPESCYPLTTVFGVLASNSADAELGFRLSQFGAALADKQPQLGLSGRALLVFGLHVTPWVRPIRSGRSFMQRSLEICLAVGDLAFAAYSHRGLLSVALFCGDPLSEVCLHAEQAIAFAEASGNWLSTEFAVLQRNLALGLMGHDEEHSFEVPASIGPHPSDGKEPLSAFFYYTMQIQLNLLAGRHELALALAERADKLSWCVRAYSEFAEYRFYTGLAHAVAYHACLPEDCEKHAKGVREHHRKLTNWSARCPANFAGRQALLAAEIARIEGRELEAERLYEESIQLAEEAGFVQIEAIAAERAAYFHEARRMKTVVLSYMAKARDSYLRWGAEAKVRQLDEMYPSLREREATPAGPRTIATPAEHLDLATVLKVSEAVSGEIVQEKLIDTVLRTAIEHAGAERGLLILPKGSQLRIQAEATTTGRAIAVDLDEMPISGAEIPDSLVLYAARTQQSVILDDASASSAFAADRYFHRKRARSVLCLPLVKQGRAVAFLYLENNLAPRVFTPARVAVLKFLASEAATSLDNARLYRELQERESRIRRLVDSNIIGIFIFDHAPDILEANQSFLKTIGYDREDLKAGRLCWAELTPPEWQDRTARARAELKATGVAQPFEKEFLRKDGSRVPVLTGGALFEDEREQGVAFVLDLSERKRAEAEARESEQRYREAQMELAHANRVAVTGQLTASIAHEVNQPNTAIIASAQAALRWLERDPPGLEQARNALTRVVQNSIRSGEVIGRIRDLIKKAPPKRDSLALNEVIRNVIELTQTEAARNGVAVRTTFAEGLPKIIGDRVQLQQVTVNLILNAIEAMGETNKGAREILIRTEGADSDSVLVSIADTGPGLAPESFERLFEPFYTTKPGGFGIGLSICRSIIVAHGGRLWADANVPRGAIFQFTVPVDGLRIG
ncbi:AAA family ATPase [Bradyrhizobium sp. Gha]|uniref:trifunctional serine/threonine-protein kinase/ATP-binding protein/sensor histidine kinase n=1 Tax=Bradyrhizobium sp. Gha TaxID=1855318 RepID=UPI0008ED86F7|nr:AAA family ATPase [Bradyrhizobium sp. Gha]SFH65605.1 PAS domain S-box-containing protein [Bradyrhizobium sp. Gha]